MIEMEAIINNINKIFYYKNNFSNLIYKKKFQHLCNVLFEWMNIFIFVSVKCQYNGSMKINLMK
jgi:hypothetical protein